MSGSKGSTARRLFLFDIDGTLITSGGAGEAAFKLALEEVCGSSDALDNVVLAGRTDAEIARELLELSGVAPTPEAITRLIDAYLHHLATRLALHPGRTLPGTLEILERLARSNHAVTGLLTGNVERGAKLKLLHYGFWHYFTFGAYADDHHDRNELGKVAMRRALETYGEEFPPDRIYIIGDTPRDIECGRAIGAKTVAVATGDFTEDALRKNAPDYVLRNLQDPQIEQIFF